MKNTIVLVQLSLKSKEGFYNDVMTLQEAEEIELHLLDRFDCIYSSVRVLGSIPKPYSNAPQLEEALKWALDEIKISRKQISPQNDFNVATEKGQRGWKLHSEGMIKIEKALRDARETD